MPKAATKPMQRALIAQPTAIVRPAPLTAESTSALRSQPCTGISNPSYETFIGIEGGQKYGSKHILGPEKKKSERCHTLSSDDRCNNTPAHLQYYVKNAGEFGRPVAHKVSTQYLSSKQGSYRVSELCTQFVNQGRVIESHAHATYHCSISALRTKGARVCCSTSGESICEEDQADTIDPAEIEDQWPEEAHREVVHNHVYAEPQSKHLNVSHCIHLMLLLRKHSCDAAGL